SLSARRHRPHRRPPDQPDQRTSALELDAACQRWPAPSRRLIIANWSLPDAYPEAAFERLDADAARHPSASPNRLMNAPHWFYCRGKVALGGTPAPRITLFP